MLHSGVVGRADRLGHGRSRYPGNIGGSAPSSNLSTPRRPSAMPSSAFAPLSSSNRPAVPSHNEMMRHYIQGLRSSPTSVMSTPVILYDCNGRAGGLPYYDVHDVNFSPEDRQPDSLAVRWSNHYYYADPHNRFHDAREAPYESMMQDVVPPVAEPTDVCRPCNPNVATPTPVEATTRNVDSVKKFKSPTPAPAGGRRSSNRGPNIAAGNGGERPPPPGGGGNGGNHPTPQNLRDNPERMAKVKTEMCHYYEDGSAKKCPWGANCNYAHGKHELKFRYTTLCLMESSGQIANATTHLVRPCMTWVSTGACPFGRRCAASTFVNSHIDCISVVFHAYIYAQFFIPITSFFSVHDPSVSAPLKYPSWLPAAAAKTNAQIIVDRLAAHRENVVHQENPIIAQSIWENCRPSHRRSNEERWSVSSSGDNGRQSILDMEQEWADTYSLVCNSGVSIFTGGIGKAISKKLTLLQKLCIVRLMRSSDGLFQQESSSSQLHRDYIFAPTHSLHSELCMILQVRFFLLIDVNFTRASELAPEYIVKEISFEEYKSRTTPWSATGHGFDPSKCVVAHEVAFAPKGDHNANVSIWFDALPIKLEQSQIKRSRRLKQKKKSQIRNHTRPNANGALISRTSSADFPTSPPEIDPFVPMLPADDQDDSHRLIMAIMDHCINSIIFRNCSSVDGEQKKKLYAHMKQLQKTFMGMTKFHEKWMWPKREGMGHVTVATKAPPGNIMPYIPLKTDKKSPCMHTWHTFGKTIGMLNTHADHLSPNDDTKRLGVFLSFDGTNQGGKAKPPYILSNLRGWWNAEATSPKKDGTWKEILLGLPENGKWEAALRLHNKKREGSIDNTTTKARNMPLSTIPFVQA
ncbi:hypothetical protein ACHAXR_007688 [Thalassiosira sp. AJA248-18]